MLTSDPAGTAGDVSLLSVLNSLLRHRGAILLIAFVTAVSFATYALTRPRTYTSVASFMPEVRQSAGSGIAAQLGMILPGNDVSESPQFYVDLLRSRQILGSAVDSAYQVRTPNGTKSMTLSALYGGNDENAAIRRELAIARLSNSLVTAVSTRTGVVTVRVAATDPNLAQAITHRLIDLLGEFNLRRRQTRASSERRFSEERLQAIRGELRTAEDRLQYFMQSNRDYRNSPGLYLQQQRFESDVTLLRQVVTTLQQATEQAKIDEVRDTPTITIIESPSVPVRPDARGAIKFALLGGVLGLVLGMTFTFLRELMSRADLRRSTEFEEFVELRGQVVADIRHPLRALARATVRRKESR